MSGERRRLRGQPLVVLAALLVGWVGARVTALSSEGGLNLPEAVLTVGTATAAPAEPVPFTFMPGPQSFAGAGLVMSPYGIPVQYVPVWSGGPAMIRGPQRRAAPGVAFEAYPDAPQLGADFPDHLIPAERRYAAASSVALLSGFQPTPFQPNAARYGETSALLGGALGRLIGNRARWSADAWALLPDDHGDAPAEGTLPATYGASQSGVVLRYRLALQDARKPSAYLRTTSTLGGLNEVSAALGLSARPFAGVPIVAAVEGRVTDSNGARRIQPAVLAVTELPTLTLPSSLRAEIFGQAGYVAGRFATPFADGQVRIDRGLLTIGRYEARVGAGAWGGIQKGAARLDAGPAATLSLPLTPRVFGRVAVDWRFRVAGDADPGSGPALTVAAGF